MESATIEIKAPAQTVFEAIRALRTGRRRTLKSLEGNVAVIDEVFEDVPVYGTVNCVWQETEVPYSRIDFKMLSSTKFKSASGSYVLTASKDGTGTILELRAELDPGLMIPFADKIASESTKRDSKMRLEVIKKQAEELFCAGRK